jgi:cytochrome c-type biogenesis protein
MSIFLPVIFAFLAGLVSFLSPCVLPLIPAYLAYLAGTSTSGEKPKQIDLFLSSVFFVIGFALVFAVMGVLLNTILKAAAYDVQTWLARLGGLIIIIFGLYLVGLLDIPWLDKEYKIRIKWRIHSKVIMSFIFGAAFAVGWSPCVGAVLGGILGLAASQPGIAFTLLFTYSIGFGVPFLIVGAFTSKASAWIDASAGWLKYVSIIFGVLLIGIGILVFTQTLSSIANLQILNRFLLK